MIDIIAVTYGHNEILKCFINSIKAQTNKNWRLVLIHDGLNINLFDDLTQNGYLHLDNIEFIQYSNQTKNYGHLLRKWALRNVVKNEYVLLTNGDNYYAPCMIDEVLKRKEDFIYFDCVHSHKGYQYFNSSLSIGNIDMGCAVINSKIAQEVGFNHVDYAADWLYFSEVIMRSPSIYKIPKTLMVHN